MRLSELAKNYLPTPIKNSILSVRAGFRLVPAYFYDLRRYLLNSSSDFPEKSPKNLRARLTERFHNVEKGLSLKNPRPGFGATKIPEFIRYLDLYLNTYGMDETTRGATSVLGRYKEFNEHAGYEDYPCKEDISRLLEKHGLSKELTEDSGVKRVERSYIQSLTRNVTDDFFLSRYSIRQFSDQDVSLDDIKSAVRIAAKSPAVCNRQSARVYLATRPETIAKLLAIQGGAAGFGTELKAVAIITTSLRNFWDAGERNQCWIDGGLFAMSFLLGLHSKGLGAVSLNWSKPPNLDKKLRAETGIADDEAVIFLVGIGGLPDSFNVAQSRRPDVSEILTLLD